MGKKRGERRSRPHARHGLRLARKAARIHMPHWGIRVLIAYMALLAIAELFYIIARTLHPSLFANPPLALLDTVMTVALIVIIVGLLDRSAWAWKGALAWFSFAIVYSVVLISFFHPPIFSLARGLVGIALALGIALNGIILWYLYEKREYFTIPGYHEHAGHEDTVFSYLMVTFWVLVLAIGVTVGNTMYSSIRQSADQSIIELSVMPFSDIDVAVSHCMRKHDARDVCLLVLAALERDLAVCTQMESELYRFVCKQL